MSQFCSLEEAFAAVPMPGKKTKKERKEQPAALAEGFVPNQLSTSVDPDRPAVRPGPAPSAMQGAAGSGARLEADNSSQEFFPLPGETAAPEEWAKAFMLEPSQAAVVAPPTRFRGPSAIREAIPAPVNGLPTLWRDAAASVAPVTSDISARLDTLTKQLESLTSPSPVQSTAELFLFVAVGLLILLAIDSILRFATAMVTRRQQGGAFVRTRSVRWR
jgi:hypothetical protein